MKITTRLRISTIISVCIAFAIGTVVSLAAYKVYQETQRVKIINDVVKEVNTLEVLTYEYFLHHEEMVRSQWESKQQSISQTLMSIESEALPHVKNTLTNMKVSLGNIKMNFSQLVLAFERRVELDQEHAALSRKYEERLGGQLVTSLNELFYDSLQLSQNQRAKIDTTKTRTMWFIIIFTLIMVCSTGVLSLMIGKSISVPIIKLQKGIDIISAGNWDYKVDLNIKSEIGILAQSFNAMVENLQKRTEELRKSRDELELRVNERTASLFESESKIRSIVKCAAEGIITINEQGIVDMFNPAAERIFGYKAEDVVGKNVSMLIPQPYRDMHDSCIANYVKTGEKKVIGIGREAEGLHKDGTVFPIHLSVGEINLKEGRMFTGIIIDITKRKKADEQIQKLSHAVEHSSSTVVITDAKGNIEFVNPNFTKTTGYTIEEAIGENTRILKSGKQKPEVYKELWETITSGNEWQGEFLNKKKNGELYWELASVSPIKNEEGVITNFIAVKEDITERKKAEKEIRGLAKFPSENPNPVLRITNKGTIIFSNKAAKLFLDTWGRKVNEAVPVDIQKTISDSFSMRSSIQKENYFKERVFSITFTPVLDQGYVNLYGLDITEKKMVEEQIKSAMEEAQRANKAKSVFLSSMSHELRTPMSTILGFAQLLESDNVEPLSKTQKENVKLILKSGNHLLELINEVLDLSRIESGRFQVSLEDVAVDCVIDEIIDILGPMALKYGIKINYRAKDNGFYVRADVTRLKQVITNLLSNAIKYNNIDGSVTISCESLKADMVRITIKDTGTGIAEDDLDSLYEPFNRLGIETFKIEGTGIGLSITKKLVELMGGSIGVESELGKGTKFYVDFVKVKVLELETGEIEDVEKGQSFHKITGGKTLLYVEDNPDNLLMLEKILKRRPNIKLLTAPEAQLGIELARTHHPDLILMDINLPGMSGFEALKSLKRHSDTKAIPVIAISASAMPEDVDKGKVAGFRDYITKPININKFLQSIDNVLTTP